MVVGQSNLTRQQDPLAIFELTIDETTDKKQVSYFFVKFAMSCSLTRLCFSQEKVIMEFDHGELYSFFTQLERMQQQLDALGK
jgi:hypothetical protein